MTLTIGFFDGVHRGHQHLLSHLKESSTIVTFSNHPIQVFKKHSPALLASLNLKLALLKQTGHKILTLPFTSEIADSSFEEFLAPFSFDRLIIGEGDAFGKGKRGTADQLRLLGLQRGFTLEIVPKLQYQGAIISSTRIRSSIHEGNLEDAEQMLGRPYCIDYPQIDPHQLPPDGNYRVWIHSQQGVDQTELSIQNQTLHFSAKERVLISFGPSLETLNPNLFELCQTSHAAS